MGKRYHCDYCDRTFKDAPTARKKHLTSLQHIKNRDDHYKQFKDPETILKEEAGKNMCLRYKNYGDCQFGSLCRYSHYNQDQIQQLKAIVAAKDEMKKIAYDPDPELIVKEFFEDAIDPEEAAEKEINPWPLPSELEGCTDLPPSLRPMSSRNFPACDFPEWGWQK